MTAVTYRVIKDHGNWAVRDERERRILCPRFSSAFSASEFIKLLASPEYEEEPHPFVISLSQIAKELRIDPFRARAALRKLGMQPETGRWKVWRGSPEYSFIINLLSKFKKKQS